MSDLNLTKLSGGKVLIGSVVLVVLGWIGSPPLHAGPFVISGNSTMNSVDATYQRSTKITGDQVTHVSRASAEVSAATSRDTYDQFTKPSAEASTKVSDHSSRFTGDSSDHTARYSEQSSEQTTHITGQSLDLSEPTFVATTDATDYSEETSEKSLEQTTAATKPLSDVTYEQSTKPTAKMTTRMSEASSEFSEHSSEYTAESSEKTAAFSEQSSQRSLDVSDETSRATYEQSSEPTMKFSDQSSRATEESILQSSEATGPLTEATYEQSTKPTADASIKMSDTTSRVSAETSEVTPQTAEATWEATTKTSNNTGEQTLKISATLDASLESTTRLTWRDYKTAKLDPDVADELIKQAFAFSGPELDYFSTLLKIPAQTLAKAIIVAAPEAPSRTQLQRLMSRVISELEKSHDS